jgi:hypothetical protein
MAFKLDRLSAFFAMVKADRTATSAFIALWEKMCGKIETQEAQQDAALVSQAAIIATLQAQFDMINANAAAANDAQETADTAGGGTARSGSASADVLSVTGTGWNNGPTVNLTGVSAGNLTISGSGPTGGTLTTGNVLSGEYRIVELAGSTTVFTGNFSLGLVGMTNNSASAVAAFSLAEVTTGAVSYRMDVRRTGGTSGGEADISLYLFTRRS